MDDRSASSSEGSQLTRSGLEAPRLSRTSNWPVRVQAESAQPLCSSPLPCLASSSASKLASKVGQLRGGGLVASGGPCTQYLLGPVPVPHCSSTTIALASKNPGYNRTLRRRRKPDYRQPGTQREWFTSRRNNCVTLSRYYAGSRADLGAYRANSRHFTGRCVPWPTWRRC